MSFINYLINGVSLGSVYAIIALGYTMVYGIAKMLNFAHGDIIMIGSYVVFVTVSSMGLPPMLGVLLAVAACTLLGVVIERVAYKPLRSASPLAVLITAIGVSYLLQNVALLIFGADTKSFTSVVKIPALKLADGQLNITGETIATILSCIVIMVCLMAFINRTRAGQAMLAVSEDKGAATLMGINVNFRYRFCTGSHCRCAVMLRLSVLNPIYRFHARYQGIRGSSIWRYRIHPRRFYRRRSLRCDRDPFQGVYFFPAFRCHRVLSTDHCTVSKTHRYSWQEDQ
jgi:branched-subunit amino acid ABC-type transport system permease component